MSNDKIDPSKTETSVSSTELTDEQLNEVTGGGSKTTTNAPKSPLVYYTITLENTMISSI
jgi:bacteriocin-like protein